MGLSEYKYAATNVELNDLNELVRRHAAKHAKIDAERLSVRVTNVVGYEIDGEEPYICPNTAEAKLDGREFGTDYTERKIRWWVQQTMISVRRPMDRSRATFVARAGRPKPPV